MSGLKIIRIRCNVSLNEIAEILGVSRQAVSIWEKGEKIVPEKRRKQLSDFLGVDEIFFGEISEEQKMQIAEKAMFRHKYNGKDIFKFKPEDGVDDLDKVMLYFKGDANISLDESYESAKRMKKETLDRIREFIHKNKGEDMESEVMRITNYTKIYNTFSDLLDTIDQQERYLKVPYRFEIIDVLDAMSVAFGLLDEEKVKEYHKSEQFVGMDSEWILELSALIKKHWGGIRDYHVNHMKEFRNRNKKSYAENLLPGVAVQIEQAEEKARKCIEEYNVYCE